MERKICRSTAKKGRRWFKFLSFFLVFAFFSCGKTAKFKGDIDEIDIRLVSAAHNLFTAGRSANDEISYSFLPNTSIQEVRLKTSLLQVSNLQQLNRQKTLDSYTQGHAGARVKEDFTVSSLDKLDLLVVVDNSSSMSPYQQRLSAGLSSLLSHISNSDWRMMVTTTSAIRRRNPSDPTQINKFYGCPRINPTDISDKVILSREDYLRNPLQTNKQFAWKVMVGELGDPIEHGLLAATSGLAGECGDGEKSWVRSDAHKAVLMLTDEENCGSDADQNCDGDLDADPQFFLDRSPAGTQLFALLHDFDRYAECTDVQYVRKPLDYRWLIAKTGGMEANICLGNYDATLAEISRNLHPIPRLAYPLAYDPEPKSIQLYVDGIAWNAAFTIIGRTIQLAVPLPDKSKALSISYNHDPLPILKVFPLSTSIDPSTLKVSIRGLNIPSNAYRVEANTVVFNEEPPEMAKIEFEYRVLKPLPKYFPLPKEALLETVKVTVDNESIADFQIVGANENREIILNEAPRDGNMIGISYETAETRTLHYPSLIYSKDKVSKVDAYDFASQKTLALLWDDNELVFAREDVKNNRLVKVVYTLTPDSKELAVKLPQDPKEGTVAILVPDSAKDCVSALVTEGDKLLFPCPGEKLERLRINYDYISQIDNVFRMRGEFSRQAVWVVKVDGIETKNYKLDSNSVSFPDRKIEANTKIEIEVFEPVFN